ncbi:O-antigen ligase family protein [Bdellovibrio reynosensis]|uniref:O-antigen ligase family protein n=1 Tax=Bdellovibrio reynosensis TaxID=2835041 RepID=A0ABY4CAA8_9BACT|nr:O-antigen ligase family protein [Bdellovibrio reynosensis]UOF01845.1 O-antigen ligase family protein [Bdellovibrio reynosensis]
MNLKALSLHNSAVFKPVWAVLLYMGLAITTLHLEVPLLVSIRLELLLFVSALSLTVLQQVLNREETFSFTHSLSIPVFLIGLYALSPLFASVFSGGELLILNDPEYKTLLKILFLGPAIYLVLSKPRYRNLILNSLVLSYSILGVYFLYRYLVLHEAREFDLRPLLNIRHGDPNFLCTFFSMTLPLALLQAWQAFSRHKSTQGVMFLTAALFLGACAIITQSRMGLIALLLGLGVLFCRRITHHPKESRFKLLVAPLVFVSLLFAFLATDVAKRFTEIKDKSNLDRLLTYDNGLKVFSDHPVFGAGMHQAKNFFYQNTNYPHFQSEVRPLEIHNTYLNVLAELGVIGFAAFAGFFIWCFWEISKCAGPVRHYLFASYVVFLVSGFGVGMSYKDLFILHFFVLAAVAKSYRDVLR